MTIAKIKMVCARCGSEDVQKDAYAEWSVQDQAWVLHSTYDHTVCEDCGGEQTDLEEVPI